MAEEQKLMASTRELMHNLLYVVLALALTPVIQGFANAINTTGSTTLALIVPLVSLFWILGIVFVSAFVMTRS